MWIKNTIVHEKANSCHENICSILLCYYRAGSAGRFGYGPVYALWPIFFVAMVCRVE
jgi:hypothetical protein